MVAQPSASPLWFEVLGPVRGRREGTDLDLGSAKQRAVLAVLLLHRNTAVPTSRHEGREPALALYADLARRLHRALGAEPGPALQAVRRRVETGAL